MTVIEQAQADGEQLQERPASERVTDLLEELSSGGSVDPSWASALAVVVSEAAPLAREPGVRVAHVVHRALRAEATTDAAPPDRLETIRAPDLGIRPSGEVQELCAPEGDEDFQRHLELVRARRSTPMFGEAELTLGALSGVLASSLQAKDMEYAYQRRDIPKRVFPNAGGLQPVDCHVVANRVAGLPPGVYAYDPVAHGLVLREAGDARTRLLSAAIRTDWLFDAAAVLALSTDLDRVTWKYGSRAYRYLHLDTGVVVGQLYLAATALQLSVNAVAAFADDALNDFLRLDGRRRFATLLVAVGPAPGRR